MGGCAKYFHILDNGQEINNLGKACGITYFDSDYLTVSFPDESNSYYGYLSPDCSDEEFVEVFNEVLGFCYKDYRYEVVTDPKLKVSRDNYSIITVRSVPVSNQILDIPNLE